MKLTSSSAINSAIKMIDIHRRTVGLTSVVITVIPYVIKRSKFNFAHVFEAS